MFYPAEDDPAYVNSSPDQQYTFDWNQIEQSYQDARRVDLETSTWPRVPLSPRTLPAFTEYSTQLSGGFPAPTAYQTLSKTYEAAGSQLQEQASGKIHTLSGGAAWSRDRCFLKRGGSKTERGLATITPRTPLGREDDQRESFQPKMLPEVPTTRDTTPNGCLTILLITIQTDFLSQT